MSMDKAAIVAHRDRHAKMKDQMIANVNLLQGVIDTDDFWLRQLEAAENEGMPPLAEPKDEFNGSS